MKKLDAYKIDLKAMHGDVETRSLMADDVFFAEIQGPEIQRGNVAVELTIREVAGAFRASFSFDGSVEVVCDRCLEPMMQPVSGEADLRIKLGETYEDDGDIIQVPEEDGILDLSWQVYEQIALQIPIRHVHAEGECKAEMQSVLSEHEAGRQAETTGEDGITADAPTDPRWDALKKLLKENEGK